MSVTGTEILNMALKAALVDSANISADDQVAWLNEGLRKYQDKIGAQDVTLNLTTVSTPALVAGTQEYVFTGYEIDEVKAVLYRQSATSNWQTLLQISREEAAAYDQQSGLPSFFYIYRPAGVQTVGFAPKPSASFAVAGATIRLMVSAKTTAITTATVGNTITVPDSAIAAIVNSVATRFAELDGNLNHSAYLRGLEQESLVLSAEQLIKTEILPNNVTCPSVFRGAGWGTNDRRWWGL